MVHIISLLLVFVEITLEIKIISVIFILPYLLYLCSEGKKRYLLNVIIIIFLYSLQNSNFYIILLSIFGIYTLYFILLSQLHYKRDNILIFMIVQAVILNLVYREYLSVFTYLYNFIGLYFVNYFYVDILKRKK